MTSPATSLLNDPFILPRAGRYANPESEAAILPILYGDLTDGVSGVWELPQIDTTAGAKVYAFAGHPVLSVVNGNSVTLYDDDGEINAGEYTFSESNDFESKGAIATASFTTDPNGPVRARAKGKASGSTLIENPITIVEDFLLNVVGLASVSSGIFDTTALEVTRERAAAAGYKAAGVLEDDFTPGEVIQQLLFNFMGTWRQRKDRKVFLFLETELVSAGALPFGESMQGYIVARQRGEALIGPRLREEIINRPAAIYRFNYFERQFIGFDDGTAKQDLKSVGIHGPLGRRGGPFEMTWIRDLTTLQTVQGVIGSLFKNGPRVFEVTQMAETLLGLERGDYVSLSLDFVCDPEDRSPLANQICRVLSKAYRHEVGEVTFRLLDTGFFLTDPCEAAGFCKADGSRRAGMDRDRVLRG